MTALIDRLERAGDVERIGDPKDRRRVLVQIKPEAIEPIKAVYMPIQKRMFALWSTFSARDLELVADFLRRSRELAVECAALIERDSSTLARRRPRGSGDDVAREATRR